jgi:hypothetical protein
MGGCELAMPNGQGDKVLRSARHNGPWFSNGRGCAELERTFNHGAASNKPVLSAPRRFATPLARSFAACNIYFSNRKVDRREELEFAGVSSLRHGLARHLPQKKKKGFYEFTSH